MTVVADLSGWRGVWTSSKGMSSPPWEAFKQKLGHFTWGFPQKEVLYLEAGLGDFQVSFFSVSENQ